MKGEIMTEVICGSSAAGLLKYSKEKYDIGKIFCIEDDYSIGNIRDDVFSEKRFNQMYSVFPETIEYMKSKIAENKNRFEEVIKQAQNGEPLRIWIGKQPFELCGICWFISELYKRCKPLPPMTMIKFPDTIRKENIIISFVGFGELSPEELELIMKNEEEVIPAFIMSEVEKWERLRKENSALRAIINGQMTSVPIDFYDSFIRAEIDKAEDEFKEAEIIGNIMGRYKFGISDELIALRIEEMIKSNELAPITKSDSLPYRRILKKIK